MFQLVTGGHIAIRSKVQDQECCQASTKIQKRLGHSIRQRCGMAACVYSCLKISKDGAVKFLRGVPCCARTIPIGRAVSVPVGKTKRQAILGHTPISHGNREAAHVFSERFSPTKKCAVLEAGH